MSYIRHTWYMQTLFGLGGPLLWVLVPFNMEKKLGNQSIIYKLISFLGVIDEVPTPFCIEVINQLTTAIQKEAGLEDGKLKDMQQP